MKDLKEQTIVRLQETSIEDDADIATIYQAAIVLGIKLESGLGSYKNIPQGMFPCYSRECEKTCCWRIDKIPACEAQENIRQRAIER